MQNTSGMIRVAMGILVVGCAIGTFLRFRGAYSAPDAVVLLGATGIEVTWPIFLLCTIGGGAVGGVLILLGILSFSSQDD